jgi:hypothetical protein
VSSSLPKEGNHSKGINAAIMLSEAGFSGLAQDVALELKRTGVNSQMVGLALRVFQVAIGQAPKYFYVQLNTNAAIVNNTTKFELQKHLTTESLLTGTTDYLLPCIHSFILTSNIPWLSFLRYGLTPVREVFHELKLIQERRNAEAMAKLKSDTSVCSELAQSPRLRTAVVVFGASLLNAACPSPCLHWFNSCFIVHRTLGRLSI